MPVGVVRQGIALGMTDTQNRNPAPGVICVLPDLDASSLPIRLVAHRAAMPRRRIGRSYDFLAGELKRGWYRALMMRHTVSSASAQTTDTAATVRLAALNSADRLARFHTWYPDIEGLFAHRAIASFLGMTPVTFSRLKARDQLN